MPPSCHASDLSDHLPDPFLQRKPRLRGLRWRVLLGTLPPSSPIDALRREAANGRRRYAEFRRRLLIDPHIIDDVQNPNHLTLDNPLSQNPESLWGRYFRNVELKRTIETDIGRLYLERGSFLQSSVCQAMMLRILLVWALVHPQYGYRQGMHEVLLRFVYVLQMDVTHLSHVRERYEDLFEDRFDAPVEKNFPYNKKGRQMVGSFSPHSAVLSIIRGDEDWVERVHPEDYALIESDDLGFDLKTMVLGSDSYGADGELGALLSARFVEHDAYCMLDALLGEHGGLADYFVIANEAGSALEACADMYHTLAAVDMSLYVHLMELGVEPQFFALRWLRVLFGREFDSDKLLLLWDAIFAAHNTAVTAEERSDAYRSSPRGSFITSFAVSMQLYLRPTLLAAYDATTCLQKLLNFPENADIGKLIEDAKAIQSLAEEAERTLPSPIVKYTSFFEQSRYSGSYKKGSRSPPFKRQIPVANKVLWQHNLGSPGLVRPPLPDSYWEERWKNSVLPEHPPDKMFNVRKMEAGSIGTPSIPASGNASKDDTLHCKESMDDPKKCTRRKLFAGIARGDAFSLPAKDGDRNASASETGSLVCIGETFSNQEHNDARNEDNVAISYFPHLGEENAYSTANVAFGELESGLTKSYSLKSDDGPVSVCGYEDSLLKYCLLLQASDVVNSTCNLSLIHLTTNSTTDSQGRKNSGTSKVVNNDAYVPPITMIKGRTNTLQILGHSIVENLQVLERALASEFSRENCDLFSNKASIGESHASGMSALAELRKISTILCEAECELGARGQKGVQHPLEALC